MCTSLNEPGYRMKSFRWLVFGLIKCIRSTHVNWLDWKICQWQRSCLCFTPNVPAHGPEMVLASQKSYSLTICMQSTNSNECTLQLDGCSHSMEVNSIKFMILCGRLRMLWNYRCFSAAIYELRWPSWTSSFELHINYMSIKPISLTTWFVCTQIVKTIKPGAACTATLIRYVHYLSQFLFW